VVLGPRILPVPVGDRPGRPQRLARLFDGNSSEQMKVSDPRRSGIFLPESGLLKECRVKTIALESTGVYWIPRFELLESEDFEVDLVEPGPLSRCGARPKTDVLDAQWIQRLHSYGLLRASVRPPDSVLALRAYWRERPMLVRSAASHVQHMQKALEQMNVKLAQVVTDITGLTGMSMIDAILDGERDPIKLAKLRDVRCHHSEDEIALALHGTWRPEHLFALRQAHALYRFHHQLITECDQQVQAELAKFANRAGEKAQTGKQRKRGRKSNDVRFEATGPLFKALGVDLTLIEGIDVGTALVILAEIGADVSRFPTEKQFASGLRLCPPQDESHTTKRRRRHRKGTHRVTIALRMYSAIPVRTPPVPSAKSLKSAQTAVGYNWQAPRPPRARSGLGAGARRPNVRRIHRILAVDAELTQVTIQVEPIVTIDPISSALQISFFSLGLLAWAGIHDSRRTRTRIAIELGGSSDGSQDPDSYLLAGPPRGEAVATGRDARRQT
jgi:transposase